MNFETHMATCAHKSNSRTTTHVTLKMYEPYNTFGCKAVLGGELYATYERLNLYGPAPKRLWKYPLRTTGDSQAVKPSWFAETAAEAPKLMRAFTSLASRRQVPIDSMQCKLNCM